MDVSFMPALILKTSQCPLINFFVVFKYALEDSTVSVASSVVFYQFNVLKHLDEHIWRAVSSPPVSFRSEIRRYSPEPSCLQIHMAVSVCPLLTFLSQTRESSCTGLHETLFHAGRFCTTTTIVLGIKSRLVQADFQRGCPSSIEGSRSLHCRAKRYSLTTAPCTVPPCPGHPVVSIS